ncbi:hypothetical protein DICPUDRAFT_91926, partial [Dictyostelium purpureum]
MGNNGSKHHNTNQLENINNDYSNNNKLNDIKESSDSIKNGAEFSNNQESTQVPEIQITSIENKDSINIARSGDLPVGDSPVIEPNGKQEEKEILPPPPVEINHDQEKPLIVDNVNEDLLSTMKVEEDILPPPPQIFVEQVSDENEQEKENEDEEGSSNNKEQKIENDENGDIKVEVESSLDDNKSPAVAPVRVTRERFQTKAESELLSLFEKTPIVD